MPKLVNPEYGRMTDEERGIMELSSRNFYQATGRAMKIPPELYEALKSKGVDMKYMEASEYLAGQMPPPIN